MEQKSYLIDTNLKTSWHHGSGGMREIKNLRVWVSEDMDRVHINGIGKAGTVLIGGIGLTVSEMDNLAKTWLKHRVDNRVVYEVQHETLCDGWVNTWSIYTEETSKEVPLLFMTREAAEKELEEYLKDVNSDPERKPEERHGRWEFRIRPVPILEADPLSLYELGIEMFEEGEKVMVELNEFYVGVITEIKRGFLTIEDEHGCTEDVTVDQVRKI